ncbi:hypothetical protein A464_2262 [Salmonella bongori N268-08]|uniref:Uncharacterized protein n=1 Tax=Salmonella bongori N268-08 TaxID=1197719 RepID=S5NGR2_SALBN|nr:hypothetical protein A464_2262 [Salmonella bongori N268-08]
MACVISLTQAYFLYVIAPQLFNFHPVLTSLFHFCYTLSEGCYSTH